MSSNKSSDMSKLIDLIVKDNNYILSFQAQPETQELSKTIIEYQEDSYSDPEGLTKILNSLIILETKIKKEIEVHSNYDYMLEEILFGILDSIKRIKIFKDEGKIIENLTKLVIC
jgi:hypothetical protein